MKIRNALVALFVLGVCVSCSGAAEPIAETSTPEPPAPADTAVPEVAVPTAETPTQEPAPVPTRVVIYQDDFSDPNSGWEHYREGDGILDYEQEAYRMLVNTTHNLFWVNAGVDLVDVVIEVDAEKKPGPEDDQFGVICRLDENYNYYVFLISSMGEYGIAKMEQGQLTILGSGEMAFSEAIRQGEESNHVSATCAGETLILAVNGQELLSVEDASIAGGDVGLAVGTFDQPGVDVFFDNFILYEP